MLAMTWAWIGSGSALVLLLAGCGDDGSGDTGAGTQVTNTAGDDDGDAGDDGEAGDTTAGGANGTGDAGATGDGTTGADDDGGDTSEGDGSTTAADSTGGSEEIEPCHRPGDCELGESCTSENGTQCACVMVCQGAPMDPPPPPVWSCVEPSSAGCPAGTPVEGEPCEGALHCTYGLPAACGGTIADCVDGAWVVEEIPVPP
jgi:hypothetical protein